MAVHVANMFSSASDNTDVVSQAIIGSNVVVLEAKGKWTEVRTDDQYSGWMRTTELRKEKPTSPYGTHGPVVQVESIFANLYREPDVTKHKPVLTVPFESRLEMIAGTQGEDERWMQIVLPDGRPAWIQRSDVTSDLRALSIEQSIALAKRFLGLPYLWAGSLQFWI